MTCWACRCALVSLILYCFHPAYSFAVQYWSVCAFAWALPFRIDVHGCALGRNRECVITQKYSSIPSPLFFILLNRRILSWKVATTSTKHYYLPIDLIDVKFRAKYTTSESAQRCPPSLGCTISVDSTFFGLRHAAVMQPVTESIFLVSICHLNDTISVLDSEYNSEDIQISNLISLTDFYCATWMRTAQPTLLFVRSSLQLNSKNKILCIPIFIGFFTNRMQSRREKTFTYIE